MRLQRRLRPFVDPLPVPGVLKPISRKQNFTFYVVRMMETFQKLHRDLPPTRIWGYEGKYPGPTIEVRRNEPVRVLWLNQLPKRHILPVDKTIHGARGNPEVRTVVHAHGVVSPPDSDGHPDAWFTRGFRETGPFFQRRIYRYPNTQRAATLWYHDHALGITRLNVYAGLAGFYLIRDREELSLNLPGANLKFPWLFRIGPLTGTVRFFIREGRNPPPAEFPILP